MQSKEIKGSLLICAASTLWAVGYLLRKNILYGISPILLTFVTSCIVTLFFTCFFRLSPVVIWAAFRGAPWHYIGLSLTGVVLGSTCMFMALDHLDLGITVMLEKLQPIFTFAFAAFFLGERIAIVRIPWMLLAFITCSLISIRDPRHFFSEDTSTQGILAAIGAAASWGGASVIGKHLTKIQPDNRIITFLRFTLGSVFLLPAFLMREQLGLILLLDLKVILITILVSIFSTGFGYLIFYKGLRQVSATLSGFLELVTPVVGMALGFVVLNERYTLIQVTSAVIFLWSIYRLCKPIEPKPL